MTSGGPDVWKSPNQNDPANSAGPSNYVGHKEQPVPITAARPPALRTTAPTEGSPPPTPARNKGLGAGAPRLRVRGRARARGWGRGGAWPAAPPPPRGADRTSPLAAPGPNPPGVTGERRGVAGWGAGEILFKLGAENPEHENLLSETW